MEIRINYLSELRKLTKKKGERIELSNRSTIENLFEILSKKYGQQFTDYIYDKRGLVKIYLQFIVNGRSIVRDVQTELKDKDEIHILLSVGGG
jgi:MoaD family protein